MHQVGRKANFPENFSFLALKTAEVVSRQIHQQRRRRRRRRRQHVTDGNFFIAEMMFFGYKKS
jgi:hypothetical protein